MKLVDNWLPILKYAWSFRLAIISSVLSTAEVLLPMFTDLFPRGLFAALAIVTGLAAAIARTVAQKALRIPDGNGK